jgi:murein L,D-transpeptidase YafK
MVLSVRFPLFSRFALIASVALTLGACEENARYRGSQRHYVPLSSEVYALMSEKGVRKDDAVLIRSFKKESELEVWKQRRDGEYVLLKTYPMCRWSGQLGPKKREGDRMAPEGFYSITPAQMNPNSAYYLSFNMGYPNAFDRAHARNGSHLMVHGACSSMGCYSMTDDQIQEIYALVREAHNGGQKGVQMQALPFRMTADNLAKHRLDTNMGFWRNLKEGADLFEVSKREPQVAVCNARYTFGSETEDNASCAVKTSPEIASAVMSRRQDDDRKVAGLVAKGVPAVRIVYDDGDQHKSFRQVLASRGSDGLNASASWASRDVGISRPDAISSGPTIIVLDSNGKPRGQVRAESSETEHVLAAAETLNAPKVAAKTETTKTETPKTETPKPAMTPRVATQVAASRPGQAGTASGAAQAATPTTVPVAASSEVAKDAPASASALVAAQPSVLQRVMSFSPFAKAEPAQASETVPVESVSPAVPQRTTAPLPPRRAQGQVPLPANVQSSLRAPQPVATAGQIE